MIPAKETDKQFHPKVHKNWLVRDGVGKRPYYAVLAPDGSEIWFDGVWPYKRLRELNPEIHVIPSKEDSPVDKLAFVETDDTDIDSILETFDPGVYITTDGHLVTEKDAPAGPRFRHQPDLKQNIL